MTDHEPEPADGATILTTTPIEPGEYVLFRRSALFVMLGSIAMPPATISHTARSNCAEIADSIIDAVQAHGTPIVVAAVEPLDPS